MEHGIIRAIFDNGSIFEGRAFNGKSIYAGRMILPNGSYY